MALPPDSPKHPAEEATVELQIPEPHDVRIGRYKLIRKIGAGGMGEIFLGEDERLNRKVALKLLPAEFTRDADRVRRFELEAKAASALNHPNIITIYEIGEADGVHYIVTEYIQGQTLRQQMAERLTIGTALDVATQMANALKAAHDVGIVHRDIKPENVMVRPDGLVKVLDFGIAKLVERPSAPQGDPYATTPEEALNETAPGIIMGTVSYMSPEQLRGQKVDARADIFSMGVVLYEVITGRTPFAGRTQVDRIAAILEADPAPLADHRPETPRDLERIVSKALRKDRDARYQLVEDLLGDLKELKQELEFQAKLRRSSPDMYITAADLGDDLRRVPATETDPTADTPSAAAPTFSGSNTATPPSGQRTDREAERRQLTVLVCGCEMFESEAYLELDTEDQIRVLGAFEHACEEPVRRFGGTVVKCNEKGLLACFGFPVAYENAARRAARTGQAILDVMETLGEQLRREDKLELNPWVGIHTGPAVVELKAGVVSLAGEARNVAVRLEEVAVAGQVICTETSYRVFQGRFRCATLGPQKIRGISQPLEMFRVERIEAPGSLLEAVAPAELSPLTGRDQEVGLLKDRWEQAQEGMGQVVLLIGEPGLGKSRLVHTLKEHVLGQMEEGEVDAPVIEWRCSPQFQNTRLYPAIDYIERALSFDREEPAEDRFDRLLHRLEQYDLVRPETAPLWASLLSLPTPDRFPPLSLTPVRQKEETFRTLLEWLHTRAARKPILFIVEDLHWVDASTLEFLGQFLAEGLHDSILTLLTFRPEFKTPWPAVAHQTSLALNRLTRRQVGELMRKKTESALPEALVGQIYERTGGVPLFVEEFTKMVQESAAPDGERASSASGQTLLGREIPATLQDLIMVRLDRMEGERELAQLAATLGREFSHELLAAVAALDEPTLEGELAKLVEAEILYAKGRPPHRSYIFKHALLEDALYNALVKGKRQQFHRRIAEVLEAQFTQTTETRPELLAHHFTEAGLGEEGVGYWLKAGLRSRDRSAEVEAIGHLNRGLMLLETLDASPARDVRELELLRPLGSAYMASRGYGAPGVGPVFARACELSERVGQPVQVFASMYGNWAFHFVRGDLWQSTDLASKALEFARQHGDPEIIMEALKMRGQTMLYRADFARAHDKVGMAVDKYDDPERTKYWEAYTSQDPAVANRCHLAVSLWHLGFPDQALRIIREMLRLARAIGHPFSLAYALHHTGWLNLGCRLGAEVTTTAEEQIVISTEQGFSLWQASGMFFKGAGLLQQGRLQEALSLVLNGLHAFQATGAELMLTYQFSALGEAYTQAGRFDDARQALDDGLALAEKNDERCYEAELHRLLGELHLAATDDQAAAEGCFRAAIEIARRQESRAWELRATTSLARLLQRQGHPDHARAALAAVYATYTEGFNTPDLVDATALLETLS